MRLGQEEVSGDSSSLKNLNDLKYMQELQQIHIHILHINLSCSICAGSTYALTSKWYTSFMKYAFRVRAILIIIIILG